MPARPIVIVGTGGSGRETLQIIRAIERQSPNTWALTGMVGRDVSHPERLTRLNVTYLGDPETLAARMPEVVGWSFVVGIADNRARRDLTLRLVEQGLEPATLIHPSVIIGDDVEIGAGTTVGPNGVITTNVRIGEGVQVNIACVISHDTTIGDYAFLGDSVTLAGDVTIEGGACLYSGTRVIPERRIGRDAVVGAGAVVTHDVPPGVTVMGVPARPVH